MENDEFLYLASKQLSNQSTPFESERLREFLENSEELRQKYYWLELFWQEKEPIYADVKNEFEKVLFKIDAPHHKEISHYSEQSSDEFIT